MRTRLFSSSPRRSRGFALFDAVVALAILAFGLLATSRLQSRSITQSTEAQSRVVAMRLADQLLSTALVDAGNRDCYTEPAAGTCGSATASQSTRDWVTAVNQALPTLVDVTATSSGSQLTVKIDWTGVATGDTRTISVTTDLSYVPPP
jgi:Tfp pilus assembly protein PilV